LPSGCWACTMLLGITGKNFGPWLIMWSKRFWGVACYK